MNEGECLKFEISALEVKRMYLTKLILFAPLTIAVTKEYQRRKDEIDIELARLKRQYDNEGIQGAASAEAQT